MSADPKPADGSAEQFQTSEEPRCADGGEACIDCLMRGFCLMQGQPTPHAD